MNSRFEGLRKLGASYWKPFLSLLAIGTTIWDALKLFGISPANTQGSPVSNSVYWRISIAVFVYIIIRFPKVAFFITRIILGSPTLPDSKEMIFRGPRPYLKEDNKSFHGREKDIERCWIQIKEQPFFVLEGESGCGKSSILNVALIPLSNQRFHVVECRVSEDPFGKLYYALRKEPYRKPDLAISRRALTEAIAAAAKTERETETDTSFTEPQCLLVCFDQFEEIFVTVKDDVREHFLAVIKESIENGNLRLIISLRNDFIDLLIGICRKLDPSMETLNIGNYYSLRAFSEEQATRVLEALLVPFYKDDPLLKQQFEDFSTALARELLRPPRDKRLCPDDEKSILPVELQTVGMMMELVGIKNFSASGLRLKGGKTGLLRDFIEDAKKYVWRRTSVSGDQALLILRQLISPAQTKWAQTAQSISITLNIPDKQVESVLEAFGEKYLVNRLPGDIGSDRGKGQRPWKYELMHEHLVQVLIEAPDPALQKARDAEERLLFWMKRTETIFADNHQNEARSFKSRLTLWFAQPIPLVESLMLWAHARAGSERWMLTRNFRGFSIRVFAIAIVLFIAFTPWILWTQTDSYIVQKVELESPVLQVASINEGESWRVRGSGWTISKNDGQDVRQWFKAIVLNNKVTNAIDLADKISVPNSRVVAYTGIVEASGKIKNLSLTSKALTGAITATREIKDKDDRARALIFIAEAIGKVGASPGIEKSLSETLTIAREIQNDSKWANPLPSIAEAMGKMGTSPETEKSLNALLAAARETEKYSERLEILTSIAKAFWQMGKAPEAQKVLTEAIAIARRSAMVKEGYIQGSALGAIAKVLGEIGASPETEKALNELLSIVREAKSVWDPDEALSPIVETLRKIGKFPEDEKVLVKIIAAARELKNDSERSKALSSIAPTLGTMGRAPEAQKVLTEATVAAREIDDRYRRAYALKYIAVARMKLGNVPETEKALTEALAASYEINNDSSHADFLRFFAEDLGKLGNSPEAQKALNDAFAVARGIKDESSRAYALGYVAIAQGRWGESPATVKTLAEVLVATREIKDESERSKGLRLIGVALGEMGESPATEKTLAEVLAAAREIKNEESRGFVLSSIATSLGKIGKSPKTEDFLTSLLTAAHEIKGDYNVRSKVLAAISITSASYANYHLSYSICEGDQCAASDKLEAFTAILIEYVKAQNPALRKQLEDEAAEQAALEDVFT
jgi:tetratricopeptide (TPR) repeat protein/energy-coupling factor transporter ATP-binding protein EcfA2